MYIDYPSVLQFLNACYNTKFLASKIHFIKVNRISHLTFLNSLLQCQSSLTKYYGSDNSRMSQHMEYVSYIIGYIKLYCVSENL